MTLQAHSAWDALSKMLKLGLLAIATMHVMQYVAYEYVYDADHWVKGYTVEPLRTNPMDPESELVQYKPGTRPWFQSRAAWLKDTGVVWDDLLWCYMLDGPRKGATVRFEGPAKPRPFPRKPGLVGHYDEHGHMIEHSTSGLWPWSGDVPEYEADCWLEPIPILHPSPLVEKRVDVPVAEPVRFRE